MAKDTTDPALLKARKLFEKSGMTLDRLGELMGYPADSARKSAWQFLHQTKDPRLSMLRRFAVALEIPIEELVAEKRKGRPE
jgi:transcriptional regulator with XRE-family HTH domain